MKSKQLFIMEAPPKGEKTCQVAWGSRMEAEERIGTIMVTGYIGWGDGTVANFMERMKSLQEDKVKKVEMVINSNGGSLEEACGIYDMMVNSGLEITAKIYGIAASAATLIACAAKRVEIGENAQYMIHRPTGYVEGTAADMEVMAKALAAVENKVVMVYAGRSGQTEESVRTMMQKETWMTAEEAVKNGFCDAIIDSSGDGNEMSRGGSTMETTPAPQPDKKGIFRRMMEAVGIDSKEYDTEEMASMRAENERLRAELEAQSVVAVNAVKMLKAAESGIELRIKEGVVNEMSSGGQAPQKLPMGGSEEKENPFANMSASEKVAWVKNNPEAANRLLKEA